ncbi:5,6-dimethylbenzimidazole synthase [Octadecabacter sp. 1_MG-2023]|uniref:5,6-dimethylbenzimidazole synthase n=1 Tax=unclassified Octadecabacter TaxID=196158 RepID=UPI001C0983EE|nr:MULTISPECIES: 5,6-dimethylbenzimidazole synthase [unclassified Octadecabacter]MBU2992569.1 5,6-dimethylbenzimidazole synthase [Octadecabacter sp. B2R22]MDO6734674.1 5,6-dimethylbenzimidazole synthase [Octadecabacter sp. 1_MG-2023]
MQMGPHHRDALADLLVWRRDVRHFKPDPVAPEVLERLRTAMDCAPAVGNARPWRVLQVEDRAKRQAIVENFKAANDKAAELYSDEKAEAYRALKLAGLQEAPVHLAIWTETAPAEGAGLGRQTMPEMLAYSTVTAIQTLWLAARAENIGVGWVSILDPKGVKAVFDVPDSWSLTGYLCLGHPADTSDTPLLHRAGWQENTTTYWEIT